MFQEIFHKKNFLCGHFSLKVWDNFIFVVGTGRSGIGPILGFWGSTSVILKFKILKFVIDLIVGAGF